MDHHAIELRGKSMRNRMVRCGVSHRNCCFKTMLIIRNHRETVGCCAFPILLLENTKNFRKLEMFVMQSVFARSIQYIVKFREIANQTSMLVSLVCPSHTFPFTHRKQFNNIQFAIQYDYLLSYYVTKQFVPTHYIVMLCGKANCYGKMGRIQI